jgi:phosphatidate cytidylyltransferase
MLRTRVITAVLMVAVILAALGSSSRWPFIAVTLLLCAGAAWEWARLNRGGPLPSLAWAGLLVALAALALAGGWRDAAPAWLWWTVGALWVGAGAAALRRGPAGWPRLPLALRWTLGLAMLWAAWMALIHARTFGINFLLSMLCVVWMADIAAYFGGRAFGRRKLAPTISPGKSWEGVWSGMAGVLALAVAWVWLDGRFGFDGPSLFTRLADGLGWALAVPLLLALCGLSVVGDLFESLVKRAAGAKDSSGLLPGHGGVLDRVDALLPVLPAALALCSLAAWVGGR